MAQPNPVGKAYLVAYAVPAGNGACRSYCAFRLVGARSNTVAPFIHRVNNPGPRGLI